MDLGTYKRVSPEVIAHVGAKVTGEVVAAHVIGTSGKSTIEDAVESEIFTADSCHNVAAELLVGPGINSIEVIKNRAIRLNDPKVSLRTGVDGLMSAPSHVTAEANVVPQNHVPAEAWVQASAQGWETGIGVAAGRRCGNGPESKGSMELLSLGGEPKGEHNNQRDQ